jgi:hypothetical protein
MSSTDLAGNHALCRIEIRTGRHQPGVLGVLQLHDQVVYISGLFYHMNCSDDRA